MGVFPSVDTAMTAVFKSLAAGAKAILVDRLCEHERARLDPNAYRIQLHDFLTPTGDSDSETQAPPNKLYKDCFKAVDKFNARAALVPVPWKLKSEKLRWLTGLIQVALSNAYALYKNNSVLAGAHPNALLTMRDFAAEVGNGVYAGRV